MMFSVTFAVDGRTNFPRDMLRYDQCHPIDGNSAAAIGNNAPPSPSLNQHCVLRRYFNTSKTHIKKLEQEHALVTSGRWASFGWSVDWTSIEIKEVPSL